MKPHSRWNFISSHPIWHLFIWVYSSLNSDTRLLKNHFLTVTGSFKRNSLLVSQHGRSLTMFLFVYILYHSLLRSRGIINGFGTQTAVHSVFRAGERNMPETPWWIAFKTGYCKCKLCVCMCLAVVRHSFFPIKNTLWPAENSSLYHLNRWELF